MAWGEPPRAPANLYSCKKAIERITTSTTFSVKYRSINRLSIGAVIAAIYRLRWGHLPLTRLIDSARIPHNGTAIIRIWQANIEKTIIAHVPIANGEVQETGGFELDGVTFPAAEVLLEFMDPADSGDGAMFPTGELIDTLDVPGLGSLEATLINAGIPTIFYALRLSV